MSSLGDMDDVEYVFSCLDSLWCLASSAKADVEGEWIQAWPLSRVVGAVHNYATTLANDLGLAGHDGPLVDHLWLVAGLAASVLDAIDSDALLLETARLRFPVRRLHRLARTTDRSYYAQLRRRREASC